MHPLFKKLNLGDIREIVVIDAPESFDATLHELGEIEVGRGFSDNTPAAFALAFATKKRQVDAFAAQIANATEGDAVVWLAYPKASSKKYTCEFNRDTGWDTMGDAGFEPVRQVAIDEDWSALRFRRAEFIKNWTR